MKTPLFYNANGDTHEANTRQLEINASYLYGYQDEADKGKLMILPNDNGSTVLTPLFDAQGNNIIEPEKAGQRYSN